jgi:hypothetical protein
MPRVVTASRRKRPYPHLAQQVISGLLTRPAGEEPMNSDLMTLDNLDEGVRTPAHRLLDQHAVRLHTGPHIPSNLLLPETIRAFARTLTRPHTG